MIEWWDACRFHVFNAFQQFGYSALNMAEIGNAQQISTKSGGNALIDLAKDDTNIMIVQVEEYTLFLEGSTPVWGTDPNLVARAADFASCILYDWSLWFELPLSPLFSWVQSQLPLNCMVTQV